MLTGTKYKKPLTIRFGVPVVPLPFNKITTPHHGGKIRLPSDIYVVQVKPVTYQYLFIDTVPRSRCSDRRRRICRQCLQDSTSLHQGRSSRDLCESSRLNFPTIFFDQFIDNLSNCI